MKPSRGFSISSVAAAGLQGLPGVIIATAFVLMFIAFLLPREWRHGETGDILFPLFLLIEFGACIAFVVAQRRDRLRSEQIEQELHRLNEGEDRAAGTNRTTTSVRLRGMPRLRPARIPWRSIAASGVSLDGLLVLAVLLLFVFGMVGIFVSPDDLWLVFLLWAVAEVAAIVGIVALERRSARQLARIVEELQQESGEAAAETGIEPARIVPSDPIRPR
jgi:hypothetical protein